jgi:hypothetical protein
MNQELARATTSSSASCWPASCTRLKQRCAILRPRRARHGERQPGECARYRRHRVISAENEAKLAESNAKADFLAGHGVLAKDGSPPPPPHGMGGDL